MLSFLVVYKSPFSGRTFNLDYVSRWNQQPSADAASTETTTTTTEKPASAAPPPAHPFHHSGHHGFNWDIKWNFNHGSAAASSEETTTTTTTESTTTTETDSFAASSSLSNSESADHKNFDGKWSYDFDHGGATTSDIKTDSFEKTHKR